MALQLHTQAGIRLQKSGAPGEISNSRPPDSVVWCSIQLSYGRVVRIAPEFFGGMRGQNRAPRRPERGHSYSLHSAMAREAESGLFSARSVPNPSS